MATAREIDDNGFLMVKACPLTSFGIFDYGAGQIGLPGDPNRIVKVFRPESAFSTPEAIASFKNIPLIDDHEMLSGFQNDEESSAPEEKGVDGILTANVYYDQPWLRGDLKVFSRSMQDLLLKGKKDLSLGYACEYIEQPGVWNGQPYEVIQTNMRGNHIALVGEGRVRGARVLDGLCFDHLDFSVIPSKSGEREMSKKNLARRAADSAAVEELKVLLPQLTKAFEGFLAEESTEPAHQGNGAENAGASDPAAQAAAAEPAVVETAEVGGGNEEGDVATEQGQMPEAGAAQAAAAQAEQPNVAESGEVVDNGGDIGGLIAQVEAVLAKLKAAAGGGEQAAAAADNVEGLQEESSVEGANVGAVTDDNDTENAQAADAEAGAAETPNAQDSENGAGAAETVAGSGQDAALAGFYADLARKDRTYKRVSAIVGAFDHSRMDARQVAVYGLKKFGLDAAKGQEQIVLDAYLSGVEKGKQKTTQVSKAADAATVTAVSAMDNYLQGGK